MMEADAAARAADEPLLARPRRASIVQKETSERDAEASDRRLLADTKRAMAASRMEEVSKHSSTQGLAAWLADYEGIDIQDEEWKDRARVLQLFSENPSVAVPTDEELLDNWRDKHDEVDGYPPDDDRAHGAQQSDEEEEADNHPAVRVTAATATPARAKVAAVKRDVAVKSASASAARVTQAAAAGEQVPALQRRCPHCYSYGTRSHATEPFRCDDCHMLSDKEYDAPQNVDARRRRDAANGQSPLETAASATHTPLLTKLDRAMLLQAQEGAPMERFTHTGGVTTEAALEHVRDCLDGLDYAPPSKAAVALVQSGRAVYLGALAPRHNQARSARDYQEEVAMLGNRLVTTGASAERPLQDVDEFLHTFLAVILPSLINRPLALLDFASLTRSVLIIHARHGWSAAQHFLDTTLNTSVTRRTAFNVADARIVSMVQDRTRQQQQQRPQQHGGGAGGAQPQRYPDTRSGVCIDWNLFTCGRQGCRLAHECMWIACTEADRNHVGKECKHKPPPRPRPPPGADRERGGSRGGRGKGGRGRRL